MKNLSLISMVLGMKRTVRILSVAIYLTIKFSLEINFQLFWLDLGNDFIHFSWMKRPPLPRCGGRQRNSNGRIVRCHFVRLAMKLVVAQAKDHEIINEGADCVW